MKYIYAFLQYRTGASSQLLAGGNNPLQYRTGGLSQRRAGGNNLMRPQSHTGRASSQLRAGGNNCVLIHSRLHTQHNIRCPPIDFDSLLVPFHTLPYFGKHQTIIWIFDLSTGVHRIQGESNQEVAYRGHVHTGSGVHRWHNSQMAL